MLRLKTSDAGFAQAFRRLVNDRRESDADVSRDVALILADVRRRGDEALAELIKPWHESLAWLMALLVVMHVAAAIKHHVIDRDGLINRMRPGR